MFLFVRCCLVALGLSPRLGLSVFWIASVDGFFGICLPRGPRRSINFFCQQCYRPTSGYGGEERREERETERVRELV